ncbi:hypothetical protein CASFOL_039090 [Castilleja foliolosa]|uniref:RNA-directed RNA polymerase n=1 Tax=Castilleja foliolosa TaxID=1961234 RepID=A0ABD3BHW2_9LAMI
MELKRKISEAHLSSHSVCSDAKRIAATPSEDSPIARLFNDVSIHALMRQVKDHEYLVRNGKKFLISIQRSTDNFHEESADDICKKARHLWEFEQKLVASCAYAAKEEYTLSEKLVCYANEESPAERMDSAMKDPWLKYILGDCVLGHKNSDAFIRGFLSILIAYWNIKELTDKYKLGTYGRPKPLYFPKVYVKTDWVRYVIDHVEDFNLREVLESKYGSDPDQVASLFEQISSFQVNGMDLGKRWTIGKRAMIDVVLHGKASEPLSLAKKFVLRPLP